MDQKLERIRQLEEMARTAPSLAQAQALTTEADRLRGTQRQGATNTSHLPPIFRN
jgi:hypothetical protein